MKPASLFIVLAIIILFLMFLIPSFGSVLTAFPPLRAVVENSSVGKEGKIETSNIYRTVDGGRVWFPQSAIDAGRKIGNVSVFDIALDVKDSNIVYAATANGLYKTVNNGQNWDKLFDKNQVLSPNASVLKVVQDERNPENIYIAAFQDRRGVFLKSSDGGLSFVQTYITEFDDYMVTDIAIDPFRSNIIYLGTTQGGFFTSKDFGETWEATYWIPGKVSNIVINPKNTSEIYVATSDRGLFRTQNNGKTWKSFSREISRAAARNQIKSIQIDPQNSNILYLGVTNGVLKSVNRGASWRFLDLLIPPKNLPIDVVVVDPTNRRNIYVAVKDLIYKSEDGGVNWSVQRIKLAGSEKRINVIEIDKKDSTSVYFGVK